ncbi:hypothetical protein C2S51_026221 [Perilla frutescens var. frutescens]|nr:hypothetical protein C2S51_026221 [Perilla frutescens var. frutescens]
MQPPKVISTDFLSTKPPPIYVAGLGRGATAFTTRSDIGLARPAPDMPDRSMPEEERYDENHKFDEFEGNEAGLFASVESDDDEDKEADAVWVAIDKRMDSRRKERRETRVKEEIENYRASNPKIYYGAVCRFEEEIVRIVKAIQEKEHAWIKDFTAVGEERGTVLSLKLDRLSESVSGSKMVDSEGYLTELKSKKIISYAEVYDINKAKLLHKSFTQTNPRQPHGWIAAARLEKMAAKLELDGVTKSRVLRKGFDHVPDSVRLWKAPRRWVELASEDDARLLLQRAVECCPLHVDLWLALSHIYRKSLSLHQATYHIHFPCIYE